MLVVEHDARAHAANSVTSVTADLAGFVGLHTFCASGRVGFHEHIGVEVVEVATLLAYHLLNTAVELDSDWPTALDVKWDLSRQWLHRGFNAIDILGVKSLQARLDT